MTLIETNCQTSHGAIKASVSTGAGMPLILLHGSGSARTVFSRLLGGPLAARYRMIALDLPGHGESDDAERPAETYTLPGLARAVDEALDQLDVDHCMIFGWSLGGHIALEMLSFRQNIVGIMLTGTPPIGHGPLGVFPAFQLTRASALASKVQFSAQDVERFARMCLGDHQTAQDLDNIRRADGRLRKIMFGSMVRGQCADERYLVEHSNVPIAMVNGLDETVSRLSYVARLRYRNLWDDICHIIPDAGHAPFLEAPDAFDALLERFAEEQAERTAEQPWPASTILRHPAPPTVPWLRAMKVARSD
jgi:pimeloyl-ACP methyl ester carboxylesterase